MDEQGNQQAGQPAAESAAPPVGAEATSQSAPEEERVTFRTAVSWGGEEFNLAPNETCSLPKSIALARVEAGLGTIDDGTDGAKGKRKK